MSESVVLPALGESVTEGTVTRWLKNVGDRVEVDEPLLEVSTDKVDTEVPSPVAGVLEEILVQEDEDAEVGAVLARIGDGTGAASAPSAPAPAATEEAPAAAPEPPVPDPARIQTVVSSYEAGFAKLQAQGNSVIDGLIADAKAEYIALKESGAGKSAILNLAVSYMGKATAMEKEVDAGFTALLSGLSSELKAAGMAEKEIAAYVSELQAAYKVEKDARRNALLDKAKSYL